VARINDSCPTHWSASGAQIIALTTRNKQLAEMSNVILTDRKKRLYDEVAQATFDDPRFKKINERFGLVQKDLVKASKYQVMVSLYGAGEKTGILQVEKNLAKVLGKKEGTLVVNSENRDLVLSEIGAQIAKVERYDLETAEALKDLRKDVKDIFDKGLKPEDHILEALAFLDADTFDLVERFTRNYDQIITPKDFKEIANIMTEHMYEKAPILSTFTKFFGRLAEDFLKTSKPSKSAIEWKSVAKIAALGKKKEGGKIPPLAARLLGLSPKERLSEQLLKRYAGLDANSSLYELIYGAKEETRRRTGFKTLKFEFKTIAPNLKKWALGRKVKLSELEIFYANKLPKSWTNVPSINFDGKLLEQNYTQNFEEKLVYRNKDGEWITNIIQVPQKTEASWWDEISNADGKINDIADVTAARTAYGVNFNHSNDATLVKQFHLWGKENGITTGTIHDAFFTNASDLLPAKRALRAIYARSLERNVIEETLKEMRKRGFPQELYDKYRKEAIDAGLIPIAGKSKIDGRIISEEDILRKQDILEEYIESFEGNLGFYGID